MQRFPRLVTPNSARMTAQKVSAPGKTATGRGMEALHACRCFQGCGKNAVGASNALCASHMHYRRFECANGIKREPSAVTNARWQLPCAMGAWQTPMAQVIYDTVSIEVFVATPSALAT